MTALEDIIKQQIRENGPMDMATYMSLCLGHPEHGYYMTRDPLVRMGISPPRRRYHKCLVR